VAVACSCCALWSTTVACQRTPGKAVEHENARALQLLFFHSRLFLGTARVLSEIIVSESRSGGASMAPAGASHINATMAVLCAAGAVRAAVLEGVLIPDSAPPQHARLRRSPPLPRVLSRNFSGTAIHQGASWVL
jgi:hypothetical protein